MENHHFPVENHHLPVKHHNFIIEKSSFLTPAVVTREVRLGRAGSNRVDPDPAWAILDCQRPCHRDDATLRSRVPAIREIYQAPACTYTIGSIYTHAGWEPKPRSPVVLAVLMMQPPVPEASIARQAYFMQLKTPPRLTAITRSQVSRG